MTRSSTRGFAVLGGIVAALFFVLHAVIPTPASADTVPHPALDGAIVAPAGLDTIVLAGGCFWGVQAVFQHVNGVVSATSGFAGGSVDSPSHEQVGSGGTGHAESVRVVFDSSKVSLGQLLEVFFSVAHDPTELNRQGPDIGPEYRSAIFYASEAQQKIVNAYIAHLKEAKVFKEPIVTEVAPLRAFHEAAAYHQNYYDAHPDSPYIVINDRPKVEALKRDFPKLWKS